MIEVRLVLPGTDEFEQVVSVEKQVFEAEGYPYDYRLLDAQRRLVGAFEDGRVVGACCSIQGTPGLMPPVLADCHIWDQGFWDTLALEGLFEELGTVAVLPEYRNQFVSMDLYRHVLADGMRRGIKHWGMVIEPERREKFNTQFFFTFEPIGDMGFHGWDIVPYSAELDVMLRNIGANSPELLSYILEPVDPSDRPVLEKRI